MSFHGLSGRSTARPVDARPNGSLTCRSRGSLATAGPPPFRPESGEAAILEVLSSELAWWWTVPPALLVLGSAAYFAFTRSAPGWRRLPLALRFTFVDRIEPEGEGDVSHFAAASIGLAASLAPGSVLGTATAVLLGGPGALFWLWLAGGLIVVYGYVGAVLGVRFRELDARGRRLGGPMLYLEHALRGRRYAGSMAVGATLVAGIAALGYGVGLPTRFATRTLEASFGVPIWIVALGIALVALLVQSRGIVTVALVTSRVVPTLILIYLLGVGVVIALRIEALLPALRDVFVSAFGGTALGGGVAGAGVFQAARLGITRGAMGGLSASGLQAVPAAAARTCEPVRQGLVTMVAIAVEALVLPTATALLILTASPVDPWTPASALQVALTGNAASGVGGRLVALGLASFAVVGLIGWGYIGARCATFLLGDRGAPVHTLAMFTTILAAGFGVIEDWSPFALIFLGLAVPNFIGVTLLSGTVWRETRSFFGDRGQQAAGVSPETVDSDRGRRPG